MFEILDFNPKSGSRFGGSKITITGGTFTDDIEETAVKVGYKWWEPIDHYCYMLSVTSTTATCRLPLDLNREVKSYEVIAFASTYEEANCEVSGDGCMFTFVDDSTLPVVTANATASFNHGTSAYEITITGTGFTDAASDIDFFLASVE